MMSLSYLEYRIEEIVRKTVAGSFPLDWKEDPITHQILKEFRSSFHSLSISEGRIPTNINWEVYKFHGKRETAHGDIGLLFQFHLPQGGFIEGAGFIEAKLRGRETSKFLQVRHEQVTRILARSPHSMLMLYDYNPVAVVDNTTAFDDDIEYYMLKRHGFRSRASVTHAPVLPLSVASAINHYDDSLYQFCNSLSSQITRRYFQMRDLDFSSSAVKAVKGFPSDIGSPNYVMVIRVMPQNLGKIDGENSEGLINTNMYFRIE
ncbi:hypothetical protein [Chlorobium ferrooxidans]|uniref:Uncharacterized protein n=1 Tax=Chlorobium ferrooxidans DSM 13031 TaxID=377431 RepID=Q0YS33_9CHLB|nr:hypothetical protein [Chlorobium ferrooxidans]EAT59177.1 hypothetical protein CferDRAFT_1184 [Chlorobium ferrooxidans DSM 13031]